LEPVRVSKRSDRGSRDHVVFSKNHDRYQMFPVRFPKTKGGDPKKHDR
jgi:hypothetical protein